MSPSFCGWCGIGTNLFLMGESFFFFKFLLGIDLLPLSQNICVSPRPFSMWPKMKSGFRSHLALILTTRIYQHDTILFTSLRSHWFYMTFFTQNSMTIQRETYQICSTVTRSKLHMNYRVDDFGMNLEGRRLLFSEWRRSFWHKLNKGDVVSRAAPRPTARRPSTPHPRETWSLETSTTESAHQEMRIDCSAFKKFFFSR